ncbi:single-stranded-DNA-specific exonuclease RecJ [Pseudobdellovibrio sp. HCB154]|uniref:single-stranded-DNA-specific exonuclease RecJ n=1 Tax=Pseudobdellovibrio sp. HCB154 TaxID=3386277 RepID=UPI00391757BB
MAIWKDKSENISALDSQSIASQKPYPELIGKLLTSRGYDDSQIESILNPKLSLLKDPFLLRGMDKAVERIKQAYLKNQKICIYADFDLDGTSGLGILKQALENLGFKDVSYYQPKRLSDGYGFHPHAVEELKTIGIDLIITVDVGITSHAAFDKANELNIDVILTDHHLPSETLPNAYCVINPNQKDCTSGLGYLCGAGVAFYLSRALKRAFAEDEKLPKKEWDLKDLLDLFCIGTLTDMVPLVDDNRVLVKHGMVVLQNTQKVGLQALMEALELTGRPLSSQDVSIKFAPKLNALSRMESEILPIHIYLEKNLNQARSMVDQILKNNQTRQALQSDAETKALALLKDWSKEDFIFVSSEEFHRGIIGLIATKLSQEFNKPAFVGSQNSEGMIVGSGRLPAGHESSLVDALGFAQSALNRFGGHSAAAGFELHATNKEELIVNLEKFYQQLKLDRREVEIEFDVAARLEEVNSHFMKWYDHIGPYGVGFTTPLFRFNKLNLNKITELKGGHLKVQFWDDKNSVDALLFSPSSSQRELLQTGRMYDILGEIQWNYFRNKQSVQILIKDLKVSESST